MIEFRDYKQKAAAISLSEIRNLEIQCPGGQWCMCCGSGCTCGCRDECPVFLAAGRRFIFEQSANQLQKDN